MYKFFFIIYVVNNIYIYIIFVLKFILKRLYVLMQLQAIEAIPCSICDCFALTGLSTSLLQSAVSMYVN